MRINKTLEAASKKEQAQPPTRPPAPSIQIPASSKASKTSAAAPTPPTTSAVPMIKLKIGGSSSAPNGVPLTATSKPAPKPKTKKPKEPKLSEVPPPEPRRDSYFDSADVDDELLEEVIAIEREKDEQRKQGRGWQDKGDELRKAQAYCDMWETNKMKSDNSVQKMDNPKCSRDRLR